jgi:hypothetical protein
MMRLVTANRRGDEIVDAGVDTRSLQGCELAVDLADLGALILGYAILELVEQGLRHE